MKVKLLSTLFLLAGQFSFSQNEEVIQGKVLNQNLPVQGVDVINFNTKTQTITDQKGDFSIKAKTNDLLVFISKDYELKRLLVNQQLSDKKVFTVFLNLKPEELKEVVVTKMESIKLSKDNGYEQGERNKISLDRAASTPMTGVYDGTIVNGMDFALIGKMLFALFKKEKETPKKTAPKIEFAVLAKNNFDEKFYLETLKLNPDQVDLFLQFCDADPKSKKITDDYNKMSMMDFLFAKNKEFKNLAALK